MNRLDYANQYIETNKNDVTGRPNYHFSAEIGWLNDPNGFTYYNGEYHLFYQYYPYDVVWHDIHWGHATTKDFIHWDYKPVALANDRWYDANGCFSGSAIEKDGKLYLMYTGHVNPNLQFDQIDSEVFQRQCVAVSTDGIQFEKIKENPLIAEDQLPKGYYIHDFRDPKVFQKDGKYYCVLCVRNATQRGEIIMYESDDLINWTFYSTVYKTKDEDNILLECPDLFEVDGKFVLIFSIMPFLPEYENDVERTTMYLIGDVDFETGEFHVEHEGILDYGSAFYAPQTTSGANGEKLLIGWMHKWEDDSENYQLKFKGMMSVPRLLSIENNTLYQTPFIDIDTHFKTTLSEKNIRLTKGEQKKMKLDAGVVSLGLDKEVETVFTVLFMEQDDQAVSFQVDTKNRKVHAVSSYGAGVEFSISDISGPITSLQWLVDTHSIEIFVNNGEKVAAFTLTDEKEYGASIVAHEEVEFATIEIHEFHK